MFSIDSRTGNVMTTIAVFAIAGAILYLARGAFFILLLSLLFAYLLEPAVEFVQRHSWLGRGDRTLAIAQVCERGLRHSLHIITIQVVRAVRGPIEAAEDVHERGLARSAGAANRDELAGVDFERHAAQGAHLGVALVVDFDDVDQLDDDAHRRRGKAKLVPIDAGGPP